jgi:hypothetical protein
MTYNNAIPQASDDPSQSQSQILANFQDLDTFLSVNHVDLNDGDQGKHKFLQMPEQGSAPSTAASEGAVYTKDDGSTTQLYYRGESSGTEVPLTGGFLASSNGYTQLQGGILLKWGNASITANGQTVTFDPSVAFTNVYAITLVRTSLTAGTQAVAIGIGSKTATNFKVFYNGSGTISINYIAVGSV